MFEMNKVFLCGNLTRDPEVRSTSSGMSVASLRLAVNRRSFNRESGGNQEETLFIDVTAWDKAAEFCRNYLTKGRRIFVEGRLKMDQWQDKQTGQNRDKIQVVSERIQFADPKPGGDEGGGEHGGGDYQDQGRGGGGRQGASSRQGGEQGNWGGSPSVRENAPGYDEPSGGNTEDDLPF